MPTAISHMRLRLAALATAGLLALPQGALANLVINGSFETGDFTGWTGIPDQTFNGVQCPGPGPFVYQGNCSAFFGPIGTTGGIQQTLATTAGQTYLISFAFLPDGGRTSSFEVDFGAQVLLSLVNPPLSAAYQFYSFSAVATGPTTNLRFLFRDDPGFLLLDAVGVEIPEPTSLALAAIALAGLAASRRARPR